MREPLPKSTAAAPKIRYVQMVGEPQLEASGKDKLLGAAAELFSQSGYEETGVATILQLAGVKAPTLYYHFGDKEGLYLAWLQGALGELGGRLKDGGERYGDVEMRLQAACQVIAGAQNCDLFQIVRDIPKLTSSERKEAALASYLENVHEPVCAAMLAGMDQGRIAQDVPGRLAGLFVLGALAQRAGLPGASFGSIETWWPAKFLKSVG